MDIIHNHPHHLGDGKVCETRLDDRGVERGECVYPSPTTRQTYQHITVQVEAMLLTKENAQEVADWCKGTIVTEYDAHDPTTEYVGINFPTPEGNKRVSEGQYLVKSPGGNFVRHSAGFFTTMFNPI